MSISALKLDHFAPPPGLTARQAMRTGSFEQVLLDVGAAKGADQADEVARKLVSLAFIEPVLAKLRETNQATGPFAPGDAERRFGPLFDQHLADRITSGANFPLVDALREHLLARSAQSAGLKEEAHG